MSIRQASKNPKWVLHCDGCWKASSNQDSTKSTMLATVFEYQEVEGPVMVVLECLFNLRRLIAEMVLLRMITITHGVTSDGLNSPTTNGMGDSHVSDRLSKPRGTTLAAEAARGSLGNTMQLFFSFSFLFSFFSVANKPQNVLRQVTMIDETGGIMGFSTSINAVATVFPR